jgi:hypothetical protein
VKLTDLERVERPAQLLFMRDVVAHQRPVVIRGEMDDWEALGRWSPANLQERCADRLVRVRRGAGTGDDQLHGLLERMDGVLSASLSETVPEVSHEVRVPQFVPRSPLSTQIDDPELWIGGADTTPLAFWPGTEGLVQVIHGQVEARLFPMSEGRGLYRRAPWQAQSTTSPVAAFDPDPSLHVRALDVSGHAVTLEPGEMLYIPPYWWRSLQTRGPAIRVHTTWTSLYRPSPWTRAGLSLLLG